MRGLLMIMELQIGYLMLLMIGILKEMKLLEIVH